MTNSPGAAGWVFLLHLFGGAMPCAWICLMSNAWLIWGMQGVNSVASTLEANQAEFEIGLCGDVDFVQVDVRSGVGTMACRRVGVAVECRL